MVSVLTFIVFLKVYSLHIHNGAFFSCGQEATVKLIAASGTESQCEGKWAEGSQQSELAFPDAPPHRHKTRNPSGDYYDKQLVLSSLVVSTETGESIAESPIRKLACVPPPAIAPT